MCTSLKLTYSVSDLQGYILKLQPQRWVSLRTSNVFCVNSWNKLFSEWLSIQQDYGGHCFHTFCRFFILLRASQRDGSGTFQVTSFQILHSLGDCSDWMQTSWIMLHWSHSLFLHRILFIFPCVHSEGHRYRCKARCVWPESSLFRMATHCLTADPVQSAPPTGQLLIIWPAMLNPFVGLPSLEPRQPRDTWHILQQIPHFSYYDTDMLFLIM